MKKLKYLILIMILILGVICLCGCDITSPDSTTLHSVDINYTTYNLNVGDVFQLNAQAKVQRGTSTPTVSNDVMISWSTTNATVATVSDKGLVTALSDGNVTIIATATYDNKTITKDCDIVIRNIPISSIVLNFDTLQIPKGHSATLLTTILPESATDKTIKWYSANPNIALVSNGVITGVGFGTTTITATSPDGSISAVCEVTVINVPIQKFALAYNTITMNRLDKLTIPTIFTPTTTTNQNVTWSTNNAYVANVNASTGEITANHLGTATITAISSDGNITSTCHVTVIGARATDLAISPSAPTITVGDKVNLSVIHYPTDSADEYTWVSQSPDVASLSVVSNTKTKIVTVTGKSAGTTVVSCISSFNEVITTCIVTVNERYPTSISLSQNQIDIILPQNYESKYNPIYTSVFATLNKDAVNCPITWIASAPDVFEIVPTDDSKVVAIKPLNNGTATLTAKTNDEKVYATCTVSVGRLFTNTSGLATELNAAVNTIYLDALEYNLGDVTLLRNVRIVGKRTADAQTTLKGNITTNKGLILENVVLQGTKTDGAILTCADNDVTIKNCVFLAPNNANYSAIRASGDSSITMIGGKINIFDNNINKSKAYDISGTSKLVFDETTLPNTDNSIANTAWAISKNTSTTTMVNLFAVNIPYALNRTSTTTNDISNLIEAPMKRLLLNNKLNSYSENNVTYAITDTSNNEVTNLAFSQTTKGLICFDNSVGAGTYKVTATYNHPDTVTPDWVITFNVTLP